MPESTADQTQINAIINAINAYATTMETFTLAAATTAANNLSAALAATQTARAAAVSAEGQ